MMISRLVNILAIVIWVAGIVLWVTLYNDYGDVYLRKTVRLPILLTTALATTVFSDYFDQFLEGLSFYAKLVGFVVLALLTYLIGSIV